MASSRQDLIAALRARGLSQAEAEQEVAQREAEAQRIVVAEAAELGREAAMAKARAHLFATEPIYVKQAPAPSPPRRQAQAPPGRPVRSPAATPSPSPPPAVSQRPSSAGSGARQQVPARQAAPSEGAAMPTSGSAGAAATAPAQPPRAPAESGVPLAGLPQRYWAWATSGPAWRFAAAVGAPVAALFVAVAVFALGGDDNQSLGLPAAAATAAARSQAAPNTTATVSANPQPPSVGSPIALSPEMTAFISSIQPVLFGYYTALDSIAKLAQDPKPGTSAWNDQVNTAVKGIKDTSTKLRELKTPPSCATAAHQALLKLADDMDKAADSLSSAARASNAGNVGSAATQLATASSQLSQAFNNLTRARC